MTAFEIDRVLSIASLLWLLLSLAIGPLLHASARSILRARWPNARPARRWVAGAVALGSHALLTASCAYLFAVMLLHAPPERGGRFLLELVVGAILAAVAGSVAVRLALRSERRPSR